MGLSNAIIKGGVLAVSNAEHHGCRFEGVHFTDITGVEFSGCEFRWCAFPKPEDMKGAALIQCALVACGGITLGMDILSECIVQGAACKECGTEMEEVSTGEGCFEVRWWKCTKCDREVSIIGEVLPALP